MAGPFTTPVAKSVPFESEPERNNGFQSKDTQEAIEEALALAVANDRYLVLCDYNGNANNGRLLEFFAGIDSFDAPLHFNGNTIVTSIISSTTSNGSNAQFEFFDKFADPTLSTPLYIFSMGGQKTQEIVGSASVPLFSLPSNGELVVRVRSGNIQKPHMQIIFSSEV
jgi:hypothetical protein